MLQVREERRSAYRFLWENQNEIYHLEDKGVNGRIILKRVLNSLGGRGLD
jgi:hypothetical protein